jgi:type I restriction enzyme R subunit
VRRDSENKAIKARLKDADDELELVIVKDMMLTGFDAPPLHTLYLDRPLKGALLMQTLARVNRTFRAKRTGCSSRTRRWPTTSRTPSPSTTSDQENKPVGRDVDEAVAIATELVAEIREMLAGCDWRAIVARGGSRAWRTRGDHCHQLPAKRGEPAERSGPRQRPALGAVSHRDRSAGSGVGTRVWP